MDRQNLPETQKIVPPVSMLLLLALTLSIIRLFVLNVMRVEGHSMEPTLRPSQIIFVNRLSYGVILPFSDRYLLMWSKPQIGDVVVLRNRKNGKTLVKRCIAREGDPISYKDGYLSVGSGKTQLGTSFPFEILEYNAVPSGHIVVLGDNRNNSVDSRAFGFVSVEQVMGRALVNHNLPQKQVQGDE
jgi:signal peptidase I